MSRRLALVLALVVVVPLVIGPVEVRAQDSGAGLQHDLENGCGAVGADFVPDNSAVIRAIFLDPTAVPELLKWVSDTDSVNYFTQSCNTHDRCYGTYGIGKLDCDWAFFTDLAQACAQAYLTPDKPSVWDYVTAPLTLGIPVVWTAETLFDAAQYTPCVAEAATLMSGAVAVAPLFGVAAFSEAQDHAQKAATCSSRHPQTSYTGIYLPPKGIERGYTDGCLVVDVAYGDGRWAGTSRLGFGNGQSVYWLDTTTEVKSKWDEEVARGQLLTSLEYGGGTWVAAFTGSPGFGPRQFFSSRGSWSDMQSDIRFAWGEGLAITELEYGDGRWVMFASAGTGITNQQWERDITSDAALSEAIQSRLDDGWAVTKLAFEEDEWFAVFSQGVDWEGNGAARRSAYHDLRVAMDDHAAAGRLEIDMEYGHGTWWGVWAIPPVDEATPGTTTPPATSPPPTPPAFISVPEVVGEWSEDAIDILLDAGFDYRFTADRAVDDPSDDGRVVDQSPDAGALRQEGTTITVTVGTYSEPEAVVIAAPDVFGRSISSARNEIEGLGLVYDYGGLISVGNPDFDGVVADQTPPAGTPLLEGDRVTVYVGDYAAPLVAVPDLGGLTESAAISEIQSRGLVAQVAGTIETTDSSYFGRVMDQDPMPYGADVAAGTTIRIWIGGAPPSPGTTAPSFPSPQFSSRVSISITGGHGSTHQIGDTVDLCLSWGSIPGEPPGKWILWDYLPADSGGQQIAEDSMLFADSTCYTMTVTGPVGYERVAIAAYEYSYSTSRYEIVDYADLWIYVTN